MSPASQKTQVDTHSKDQNMALTLMLSLKLGEFPLAGMSKFVISIEITICKRFFQRFTKLRRCEMDAIILARNEMLFCDWLRILALCMLRGARWEYNL